MEALAVMGVWLILGLQWLQAGIRSAGYCLQASKLGICETVTSKHPQARSCRPGNFTLGVWRPAGQRQDGHPGHEQFGLCMMLARPSARN